MEKSVVISGEASETDSDEEITNKTAKQVIIYPANIGLLVFKTVSF